MNKEEGILNKEQGILNNELTGNYRAYEVLYNSSY